MILRSFLFIPAYKLNYIEKAVNSEADAMILDLEDSVPEQMKKSAREVICLCSEKGMFLDKTVFVRINPVNSKDFVQDMCQILLPGICGIMPAKIKSAQDIVYLDQLLSFFEMKNGIDNGHFLMAPLIETANAVIQIYAIAKASRRLAALCLGGEDYLNDLNSIYTYQETALAVPRALLVNAARANGLLPIDTPYINISDTEGFYTSALKAYQNGFAGNLLLHPKQIAIANKAFFPDEETTANAQKTLQALDGMERNIIVQGGNLIGPPMVKKARTVIAQKDALKPCKEKENRK